MLRSLVSASLRFRFVVIIGALALMAVGLWTAMKAPLDVFPEFAPPLVEVQTEVPGMSTEAVEALVSIPIENALNGVPHMTRMRSKSVQGLSSVMMWFERGTDLYRVRQMVSERVGEAKHQLPTQAETPHLMPPLSSTSRVLHIGLTPKPADKLKPGEKSLNQVEISAKMKREIEQALRAVRGVANVSTYGLHDKQFQVLVKPRELAAQGVTLNQVILAVTNGISYSGLGYLVSPNQQMAVHTSSKIQKPEDMAHILVGHRKGAQIELREVAELTEGTALFIGEGVINDDAGLFVVVEKDPDANTLEVTRAVEAVMENLKPSLQGIEITMDIFRPATFIEMALANLRTAMIIGCILVSLILIAFLFEWRTAVISLTAIPLSLVAAVATMCFFGMTINTMVLAGLAIAIGEVVDDAIIDVENIVRRLHLNAALPKPRSAFSVVLNASLEVRSAVVYASFIVALVCLPIFFLGGVAGSFFRPLALAYILSVMASLVVALVVTPAMCYMLLVKKPDGPLMAKIRPIFDSVLPPGLLRPLAALVALVLISGAIYLFVPVVHDYSREFWCVAGIVAALIGVQAIRTGLMPNSSVLGEEAPLVRWIRNGYQVILEPVLNRPGVVLGVMAGLFVMALIVYPQLKEEYLPQFQENDFLMHWVAKPGTSMDVLREDIIRVSKEMRAETPVKAYGSHIARAWAGEEVYGPNFSELWVSLGRFDGDHIAARKKIDAVMARHPGFEHDLLTYLQERIKEVLSGASASVVMRIYGPELKDLRARAQEVRNAIEQGNTGQEGKVEGVTDLKVESQDLIPQLEVVIDPYRANRRGLTVKNVVDSLRTLINGTTVAQVHQEGQVSYDVVVWSHPDVRVSWHDLKRLEIDLPTGTGTVPLHDVADVKPVSASNSVRREKASRCIDVTCNVKGRDLGSVHHDIEKRVKALPDKAGYRVEFLGEYAARAENQRQLVGVSILAFLGIALLLYIDFRSARLMVITLITMLFALIGGVAAAYMTGGILSLGSLVGFITVFGIAARNGIMMVSHYRHLETEEGMKFGRALIVRGAQERVAPILMTALAAGLGLLPLAISGSKPGYEVEYPMAVVILGGLFTSTLLNLLVLPVLYERFGRVNEANMAAMEDEEEVHIAPARGYS